MPAVNAETANARLNDAFAPHVQSLGLSVESIDGNGAVLRMPYSDDICRADRIICGQALMALIDTCMVFVCYGGLDEYGDVTTVSQNTSFLRPAVGGDVVATGRVVKLGRTLIFGEVSLVVEGDPRTVCTGTSTYAILG